MSGHTDETKAAVLAAILSGSVIAQVAREFKVSRSTIRLWRREAGHAPALISDEKKADLGALIADYLRAGLSALEAQARVFADPEWIKAQPAGELAILHGVLSDKITRVLTALEPFEDAPIASGSG